MEWKGYVGGVLWLKLYASGVAVIGGLEMVRFWPGFDLVFLGCLLMCLY